MEYIIDLERINYLTSSEKDNPAGSGSYVGGTFVYSISRKILKEFLEIYLEGTGRRSISISYDQIIETLVYNKVLITKADVRDRKINEVIS